MVCKFGKMELNIRDSGGSIKPVARENFGTWTEIFLKENGRMIKQMDMVFIFIKMVLNMKENGRMIYSMEKERKYGQIIQCMKDFIMKVRNMAKAYISGKMDLVTTESGTKIELKDMVSINGKMVEHS